MKYKRFWMSLAGLVAVVVILIFDAWTAAQNIDEAYETVGKIMMFFLTLQSSTDYFANRQKKNNSMEAGTDGSSR